MRSLRVRWVDGVDGGEGMMTHTDIVLPSSRTRTPEPEMSSSSRLGSRSGSRSRMRDENILQPSSMALQLSLSPLARIFMLSLTKQFF